MVALWRSRAASRCTILLLLCLAGCAQERGSVSGFTLLPSLVGLQNATTSEGDPSDFATATAVVKKPLAKHGADIPLCQSQQPSRNLECLPHAADFASRPADHKPRSDDSIVPVALELPTPQEALPLPKDEPATNSSATPGLAEPVWPEAAQAEPAVSPAPVFADGAENELRNVWGILGLRGYPYGDHIASNGVEFHQLFALDFDFNVMLWREHNVYLFFDSVFWGQKAAPGITNAHQGAFDFSKREFDLNVGVAWNYYGPWEARVFGYSFNNLNRGTSDVSPSGFNDGVGLENRYYLGSTYESLGTAAFDPSRAAFLSVGFYPTKDMVDTRGEQFRPGFFAHAYLTHDLWGERCYLFGDFQFITSRTCSAELFLLDAGVAVRPCQKAPRLEFRLGTQDIFNLRAVDGEYSAYMSIRYVF